MTEVPIQPDALERARPDVLGYPSPTTSRYLIFVVALLGAGLFVGNYVHNMVWGESWNQTVSQCLNRTGGSTPDNLVAGSREFSACTADAERTRAAVTALGALAIVVASAALMWVAPMIVVRRRRLRPLPEGLAGAADRFATLAREAGVAGRVAPVLGPTEQRDGFSFGAPGRYRVALPPAAAVRWSDATVFDPLVTHELAHVRHRDVGLAWVTRLVWWALVPLLAVPVVVGVVERDYSILGSYLWRVALLAAVVALLSNHLLRSREHDADLRAAQLQREPGPMLGLLRRLRTRETSAIGRVLAKHPEPAQRVAVLEDPVLVTRTGFVDGLTGGFLSAAAMPLLVSSLTPLLAASGAVIGAYVLSAALLGPMLAGSVGLGLWRAALLARLTRTTTPALGVATGTGLGLLLGQAVSLQQAGIGSLTGVAQPVWLLVTGLAGAGAVVVSAGLAHLWADVSPRLASPRPAWVVALVVNALLFGTLLWACTVFQSSVDLGGWALARLALLSTLSSWWAVLIVLLLAACAATALALRTDGGPAPAWLLEAGTASWPAALPIAPRTVLAGLAGGACGGVAIVAFRLASGPAADDAATLQRFQAYQWVAVLAAAAVLVALVLAEVSRGAGAAVLGGQLAVGHGDAGFHGPQHRPRGRPGPAAGRRDGPPRLGARVLRLPARGARRRAAGGGPAPHRPGRAARPRRGHGRHRRWSWPSWAPRPHSPGGTCWSVPRPRRRGDGRRPAAERAPGRALDRGGGVRVGGGHRDRHRLRGHRGARRGAADRPHPRRRGAGHGHGRRGRGAAARPRQPHGAAAGRRPRTRGRPRRGASAASSSPSSATSCCVTPARCSTRRRSPAWSTCRRPRPGTGRAGRTGAARWSARCSGD